MNGFNFTERTRVALALAREEASALDHEYVGTEHILLGILAEGGGIGVTVIRNLGAEPDAVARRILEAVTRGRHSAHGPDLPYTSRAKRVLELAMEQARDLGHSYVGTEHLLLGLIAEGKGIAAQVLAMAGLGLDAARAEVQRLLGTPMKEEPVRRRRVWFEVPNGERIERVDISLHLHGGEVRQRSFATAREAAEYLWRGGA